MEVVLAAVTPAARGTLTGSSVSEIYLLLQEILESFTMDVGLLISLI